jgi:proteic killer suppression protein
MRYTCQVIKSFRHSGIEKFFKTGSKAGIQPAHAAKLTTQLYVVDQAKSPADMNAPGWRLHPLIGDLENHWSVKVNGNWRLTFRFDGENAILVDYRDYHRG